MNKMKILIPNVTSAKNLGDLAMLESLLKLIRRDFPKAQIVVHSSNPSTHHLKVSKIKPTLYWETVFENTNPLIRVFKLTHLMYMYLSATLRIKPILCKCILKEIINDYQEANLIIFVGGGYLRSQKGATQSLNLFMSATPFMFANLMKTPKIVAPISFGPFAYQWQEKLVASILSKIEIIEVREDYSYQRLRKYLNTVIRGYDQAILTPKFSGVNNKSKKPIVGFTIRHWFNDERQTSLENAVFKSLVSFSKSIKAKVLPIVQVDSFEYGETDEIISQRIAENLRNQGIEVLPLKILKNLEDAIKTYGKIDLLLGMRMHSNIIAATQNVPFVAISYEYKTEGIANDLGVGKFCIKGENITEKKINALLNKVYQFRNNYKKTIKNSVNEISIKETERWHINLNKKSIGAYI